MKNGSSKKKISQTTGNENLEKEEDEMVKRDCGGL